MVLTVAKGILNYLQGVDVFLSIEGSFEGGVFVGIIMALSEYFSDKSLERKGIRFSDSGVNQVRKILLNQSSIDLANINKKAMRCVNISKILEEKETSLTAKTGFTWKSFGEVVNISVFPMSGDERHIEISSRPSIGSTVIDWGKNNENVEVILDFYRSEYGQNIIENKSN